MTESSKTLSRRTLDDGGSLADHLQALAEGRLDFTPEEEAQIQARVRSRASAQTSKADTSKAGVDIVFPRGR